MLISFSACVCRVERLCQCCTTRSGSGTVGERQTHELVTQSTLHLGLRLDLLLLLLGELLQDGRLAAQRVLLPHRREVAIVGFGFLSTRRTAWSAHARAEHAEQHERERKRDTRRR